MEHKGWMIRLKGTHTYSKGAIRSSYSSAHDGKFYYVDWTSKKGKVWSTEAALKEHLLKYTKLAGMPTEWEVTEITEAPSKPIEDWFDEKMTLKLLKRN